MVKFAPPRPEAPGQATADPPPKLLLPVPEAVKVLGGICRSTLYKITQPRGTLRSVRVNRRVMYYVDDVQEWIRGLGATLSPLKAIRAKCLDCSAGSRAEVRLCPVEDCSLYPFRMRRNRRRRGAKPAGDQSR